ncbi:tetracenomycin C resistance and export protein [Clostridium pasteurianum DSM 525 = ATCC 6013]|uniref:Drug resistance transporter, EmrB/QacA subfamily n=1 Tax=Clostridium pasteurianum DSM 525 = ATCC 6013 TaxID=1262449 RepID=A0A0H3J186_CLOPA|nr:MFS transporter [Clostridium pasteurianum]AJA46477.1 tetracenomycin C resistance and export protein [Clostridium pasteurianum DSM 525 = ATCC 6013]AJA50465.1 tetracenomycin C resistance and export protein [Clostridium pasteurianum DSM 525 = ATCC 6013]AOZ73907.1 permease [Clostridium pasteurianum DSM 525 = ATCC 6013]AOZ77704.1 permease [Clostridium pasteurianum]ELP61052.1 MDR-type permease [Clostridium pasteurianum DSM 525 = ATCC 6013]
MKKNKVILGFTALIIGCFLSILDSTIVNIALPDIANYFNESINNISWITTGYLLSFSVFLIIGSKIADQFGRKKVFIIGLIVFGGASGLCGFSNSILFLIIMRFIQGIGAAILTPVIIPLGLEIFGKEKRGFIIGVSGAISALAAASGPPLGGIMLEYLNWKTIFYVNVPLCMIAVFLGIVFLDESFDNTVSKKIDIAGIILLTLSLFCLTFALLKGGDYGWNSSTIVTLFITFIISMIVFLIIESRISEPMLPLNLFKESTFTNSCICYTMVGFGIAAPLLILNFYLEKILMYSALKSGLILMTLSLSGVVSVPLGSFLSSKIGSRVINFLGIIFMAIATVGLSYIDNNTAILNIRLVLVIFGFGLGFSAQSISSAIKYLPLEKSGMASGIINAGRQIGTCIGVAILVSILNTNVSNAIVNIKTNVKHEINMDKTLNSDIKENMVIEVDNIKSDSNSFSKEDIEKNIDEEGKKVLAKTPQEKRVFVLSNLEQQKSKVLNIIDYSQDIKNKEISKAFNNTFRVSYIILFVFSIFGLFTDKKIRE